VDFSRESVSDSHRFSWRNTWNVTNVTDDGKGNEKKMAKEHDHADHAPCAHHPTAFLEKHRTNLKIRQWS